jgi:hypothetical protein
MRQFFAATFVTLCLSAGTVASAAEVTFVMNNGDRHTGQLVYEPGKNVLGVLVNGQRRMYPVPDIAVILYAPGDPSKDELNQLPTSGNPPELERHTLVMRDGRILKGKVYRWETDSVTFDTTSGRATYNANDVARLYLSGPPARNVFNNIINSPSPSQPAATAGRGWGRGRRGGGTPEAQVRVEASRAWTDTGLVVRAGEPLSFNVNGTITFGANMQAGPDGNKDLPPNRNYPVPSMAVGGLVGRVGNGRPFPIGSTKSPIEMPNDGRLLLGVNDDQLEDNSDAFDVQIQRR